MFKVENCKYGMLSSKFSNYREEPSCFQCNDGYKLLGNDGKNGARCIFWSNIAESMEGCRIFEDLNSGICKHCKDGYMALKGGRNCQKMTNTTDDVNYRFGLMNSDSNRKIVTTTVGVEDVEGEGWTFKDQPTRKSTIKIAYIKIVYDKNKTMRVTFAGTWILADGTKKEIKNAQISSTGAITD